MNILIQILMILNLFLFTSCTDAKKLSDDKNKIHWHKAGMPKALEMAQKDNKPLFVYWGAVWCPPCNVVKSTIFKNTQFIQATRDYVSVYLDGDTDEAQKWGEKLKVMGYPTLMVLSPKGKEVLRLSASNDVKDLVSTLHYTKNQWNPIGEVLNQVLASEKVDTQKLRALTMYSWSQDKEVKEKSEEYSQKLFDLDQKLSEKQFKKEKSILFLTALSVYLGGLKENQALKKELKKAYKDRLLSIMNDKETLAVNIQAVSYDAESFVKYLTSSDKKKLSKGRKELIDHYISVLSSYRQQAGEKDHDNYFSSYYPHLDFEESYKVAIDQKTKSEAKAYTDKALAATKDPKARVALLSHASYILFKMGFKDRAKKILVSEIKTAINPYYLMSTLGYFEKQEGNKKKALEWYEKSYKAAEGPATQLQWYGNYIRNLIKLSPKSNKDIKIHVTQLFSDYTNMADSFWGRNYRVLNKLKKSVSQWAKDNKENTWVKSVQKKGQDKCSKSDKKVYKEACTKFYKDFI